MTFRTHITVGGILGGLIGIIPVIDPGMLSGIALGSISSLLPDVDEKRSLIGRRLLPLSTIISPFTRHRGVTHSLIGILLFTVLVTPLLILIDHINFILPLVFGYLSHVLIDSLNPGGVPFLWTKRRMYSYAKIKTESIQETLVVFPISMAIVGLMLYLGYTFNLLGPIF